MKVAVVCPGLKHYYFESVKDTDADVVVLEEPFVSENNIILKTIERFLKKTGSWRLYKRSIIEWKKYCAECSDVIIFDQAFSVSLVKALHDIKSNLRIHIYLWNPIFMDQTILKALNQVKDLVDIYSFDKNDCARYGFIFSPMVYDLQSKTNMSQDDKEPYYDVVFVGYIKNRGDYLSSIYRTLCKQGLNLYFYVLNNIDTKDEMPFVLHSKYLDYASYQNYVRNTKAILDITQEGQVGLTIRTLETIAYGKKLITNNTDIINYDFYDRNNIFVLGVDSIDGIKEFLYSPYTEIGWDVLKRYNFCDWAKSFRAYR